MARTKNAGPRDNHPIPRRPEEYAKGAAPDSFGPDSQATNNSMAGDDVPAGFQRNRLEDASSDAFNSTGIQGLILLE
jgi:hypothetical protein